MFYNEDGAANSHIRQCCKGKNRREYNTDDKQSFINAYFCLLVFLLFDLQN